MVIVTVKTGRHKFELDESDEIMYNGSIYQLITRKIHKGIGNFTYPVIANGFAERLIENGVLVLDRTEQRSIKVQIYKVKQSDGETQ